MPKSIKSNISSYILDILLFLFIFILFYGVYYLSQGMNIPFSLTDEPKINLDPSNLPYYAGRSVLRIFIAFAFSLLFSLAYGYIAAKNKLAQIVLIPLLDILQSIPILGFLSATILMFINLFPHKLTGVELASIFSIFTSMVWNMTFSVYQSILSEPTELKEATQILHLNGWQQFLKLDAPISIIGLVWNSMMSFGGAWFFLAASEAISVMGQNIQLPGVGTYLAVATTEGNITAMFYAIITMIIMIITIDQLFWRPLVVWSQKFKVELAENENQASSWAFDILQHSILFTNLITLIVFPIGKLISTIINHTIQVANTLEHKVIHTTSPTVFRYITKIIGVMLLVYILTPLLLSSIENIEKLQITDFTETLSLGLLTLLRVLAALLISLAWTLPLGVTIGLQPKLAEKIQPIIQIVAAFPANMIFPFATILFLKYNFNFEYGSIFLMMLGTQWYILFNVIAGAMSIPTDLLEASQMFHLTGWHKWRYVILPSIFPYLLTGLITASGGAWNASIISEIVIWKDNTLTAHGLGAYVNQATTDGNWPHIIIGIMVMCLFVILANRLLWQKLYQLAEKKFHLD